MGKKIMCLGMALIMLFSFTGCESLATYKTNAKIKLDNYVSELPITFVGADSGNKNYINGLKVDKIVNEGKACIDNASNKKGVNKALDGAKKEFGTIPIVFPMSSSARTIDVETESLGVHFFFYLKIFDENLSFECTAGAGAIYSFPHSNEPLSPKYDGFFGRQPQIVRWYAECVSLDNGFYILFEQDFIDFIIKIDDIIIGYIVVEMSFVRTDYIPKLLASVVSPKIDGNYQAMDENQVKADIEAIKNDNN